MFLFLFFFFFSFLFHPFLFFSLCVCTVLGLLAWVVGCRPFPIFYVFYRRDFLPLGLVGRGMVMVPGALKSQLISFSFS